MSTFLSITSVQARKPSLTLVRSSPTSCILSLMRLLTHGSYISVAELAETCVQQYGKDYRYWYQRISVLFKGNTSNRKYLKDFYRVYNDGQAVIYHAKEGEVLS